MAKDKNNFFDINEEEEELLNGQEEEEEGQGEDENEDEHEGDEESAEGEGQEEEEEPEVEFEEDEKYNKKNWRVDPVANAEDEKDKTYSKDVQKRIGKLKASLTEAGRQRDNSLRDQNELASFAQRLKAENEALKQKLHAGNLSTLKSQAEALESEAAAARKDVQTALDTGNTAALLDAQDRMNTARQKATVIRREIEKTPEVAPVQQQQQPQSQPQVRQQQDNSAADAWTQRNPWFQINQHGQALNSESVTAINAHYEAIQSGIPQGSPAYFAHIDRTVKAEHPELFKAATAKKKASSTVVPSSRVTTGQQANQGGKQKFIIKPETRRLAEKMGFTTPDEIKAFALDQQRSIKESRS